MNIELSNKNYARFVATFCFTVFLRFNASKHRGLRCYKLWPVDIMVFFYRIVTIKYLEIERSILDGREERFTRKLRNINDLQL